MATVPQNQDLQVHQAWSRLMHKLSHGQWQAITRMQRASRRLRAGVR